MLKGLQQIIAQPATIIHFDINREYTHKTNAIQETEIFATLSKVSLITPYLVMN